MGLLIFAYTERLGVFLLASMIITLCGSFLLHVPPCSKGSKKDSDTISIRSDLAKYFEACNVVGSTVILDNSSQKWLITDLSDANNPSLPASTFKIINLLIALETGVIDHENEVVEWVGHTDTIKYGYRPDIYKDMSVQEAFKKSAGWVFVELAKRIGKERYRHYLQMCNYGNKNLSESDIDFWNFGALGISPINQVTFLKNVIEGNVPFSKKNIAILKRVMLSEENENYKITAKTGWTRVNGLNIGWWVGYVETQQGIYYFATRLLQDRKFNSADFGPCRIEITKSILRDINAI